MHNLELCEKIVYNWRSYKEIKKNHHSLTNQNNSSTKASKSFTLFHFPNLSSIYTVIMYLINFISSPDTGYCTTKGPTLKPPKPLKWANGLFFSIGGLLASPLSYSQPSSMDSCRSTARRFSCAILHWSTRQYIHPSIHYHYMYTHLIKFNNLSSPWCVQES